MPRLRHLPLIIQVKLIYLKINFTDQMRGWQAVEAQKKNHRGYTKKKKADNGRRIQPNRYRRLLHNNGPWRTTWNAYVEMDVSGYLILWTIWYYRTFTLCNHPTLWGHTHKVTSSCVGLSPGRPLPCQLVWSVSLLQRDSSTISWYPSDKAAFWALQNRESDPGLKHIC